MNPTGSRFGVAASPHCSRFAMDFSRLDAICQEAVVDENKRITLGYIGYIYICVYVLYMYLGKLYRPHCDLIGIMVSKGNHPQMALFQVSELL